MSDVPRVVIIAGPNGTGKTTFAREFLPNEAHCPDFINADLIAASLSPFAPEAAALRAGRLMLEEIEIRITRRRSFAFETTLSGLGYARQIPEWRRMGYFVNLVFLSLPNVEMALSRVAGRVAQGGHSIPEAVVRRRFDSGLRNFLRLYKPLVKAWVLYDNSGQIPIFIEGGQNRMSNSTSEFRDPDLLKVGDPLRRAAVRAHELARQTGTPCYVWQDGRVVDLNAPDRVAPTLPAT